MEVSMSEIKEGSIIKLKKLHPCGSQEWKVLHAGSMLHIKCLGCGHLTEVQARKIERNIIGVRQE